MQLMPTMVHYNIVPTSDIPNDLYSVGAGLKLKVTKMSSLTFEYYYQLPGRKIAPTHITPFLSATKLKQAVTCSRYMLPIQRA